MEDISKLTPQEAQKLLTMPLPPDIDNMVLKLGNTSSKSTAQISQGYEIVIRGLVYKINVLNAQIAELVKKPVGRRKAKTMGKAINNSKPGDPVKIKL